MAHRQNMMGFLLLYGLQAKNIFYIFKVLQKEIKNMEH